MKTKKLRIGISMRVTDALSYHEKRDTISHDWSNYLLNIFPDTQWLYIPNIGESHIAEYIKKWELNAFILSGGEDLGKSPERDETEYAIYKYAINNKLPLLGICRGLQAIYFWNGGRVLNQSTEFKQRHVAQIHKVLIGNLSYKVNSYHGNKLDKSSLPKSLKIIAICIDDNTIEAVSGDNILAMMWHPEREESFQEWEIKLIRSFFKRRDEI